MLTDYRVKGSAKDSSVCTWERGGAIIRYRGPGGQLEFRFDSIGKKLSGFSTSAVITTTATALRLQAVEEIQDFTSNHRQCL